MSTRIRRWLAITVCLVVPVATVWIGSTATGEQSDSVDPSYPPKCAAIHRQATAGAAGEALKSTQTLLSSPTATLEEQGCAQDAFNQLTAAGVHPEFKGGAAVKPLNL